MNAPLASVASPEIHQPESDRLPLAQPAIDEVVAQVQIDCAQEPQRYLVDTVVPFGGE